MSTTKAPKKQPKKKKTAKTAAATSPAKKMPAKKTEKNAPLQSNIANASMRTCIRELATYLTGLQEAISSATHASITDELLAGLTELSMTAREVVKTRDAFDRLVMDHSNIAVGLDESEVTVTADNSAWGLSIEPGTKKRTPKWKEQATVEASDLHIQKTRNHVFLEVLTAVTGKAGISEAEKNVVERLTLRPFDGDAYAKGVLADTPEKQTKSKVTIKQGA